MVRIDNKPQFMLHSLLVWTCVKFYQIFTFVQFNDNGETRHVQYAFRLNDNKLMLAFLKSPLTLPSFSRNSGFKLRPEAGYRT